MPTWSDDYDNATEAQRRRMAEIREAEIQRRLAEDAQRKADHAALVEARRREREGR